MLSWLAPSLPCVRYKILPARLLGGDNGIKLSLLGFLVVKTVQNSPCIPKKRHIEPFRASRESFVPEVGPCGSCWESFVPEVGLCGSCWESFVPHMRCEGVCWESFVPEVGPRGSCWARFVSSWHLPCVQLSGFRHPPVPQPGPPAPSGALHAGGGGGFAALGAGCRRVAGVSRLSCCNSPRLVATRPRFEAVRSPKCRSFG